MIPATIQAPLFSALLFIVIASPTTFKLVNDALAQPIFRMPAVQGGVPTKFGLLLHALVFFAISYMFLSNK